VDVTFTLTDDFPTPTPHWSFPNSPYPYDDNLSVVQITYSRTSSSTSGWNFSAIAIDNQSFTGKKYFQIDGVAQFWVKSLENASIVLVVKNLLAKGQPDWKACIKLTVSNSSSSLGPYTSPDPQLVLQPTSGN
jgi:hypothetical protein